MCEKIASYLSGEELCKSCSYVKENKTIKPIFSNTKSQTYVPNYNMRPTSSVAVLLAQESLPKAEQTYDSSLVILPMHWGFISRQADWNCPVSVGVFRMTFAVQMANFLPASMFAPDLKQGHRCVILCNGYYRLDATGNDQPYYIYQEKRAESIKELGDGLDEPILKLAGVYNMKDDSKFGVRYSCSIITRVADRTIWDVNLRMPIVLNTTRDVEKWIFPNELTYVQAFDFIRDRGSEDLCPTFRLKYHPVDKELINDAKNNDKRCIEPISLNKRKTTEPTPSTSGLSSKKGLSKRKRSK